MYLYDVVEAEDGNFVALGYSAYFFDSPFWIVKTDGVDNTKKDWSVLYTSKESFEEAVALTKKDKDTYVITGWIMGRGGDVDMSRAEYSGIWAFEINDKDGSMGSQNVLGGSGFEEPTSIQTLSNGNILISGYTSSYDGDAFGGYGSNDFWLLELDDNLDTLLTHKFGGMLSDKLASVAETKAGDAFYVAGTTSSTDYYVNRNVGESDIWVGKINANKSISVENIQTLQDFPVPKKEFLIC